MLVDGARRMSFQPPSDARGMKHVALRARNLQDALGSVQRRVTEGAQQMPALDLTRPPVRLPLLTLRKVALVFKRGLPQLQHDPSMSARRPAAIPTLRKK